MKHQKKPAGDDAGRGCAVNNDVYQGCPALVHGIARLYIRYLSTAAGISTSCRQQIEVVIMNFIFALLVGAFISGYSLYRHNRLIESRQLPRVHRRRHAHYRTLSPAPHGIDAPITLTEALKERLVVVQRENHIVIKAA
ncbi:hypothetical protein [Sodalis praecaptivus]|uniref:hypothetical protein n=1 Tax=Sodalis TaxID=84565 RepID=UPI0011DDFB5C|nr:hypothetical protein [Sodalis praecaptivus]